MDDHGGSIGSEEAVFGKSFRSVRDPLTADIVGGRALSGALESDPMATGRRSQIDPHRYVGLYQKAGPNPAIVAFRLLRMS